MAAAEHILSCKDCVHCSQMSILCCKYDQRGASGGIPADLIPQRSPTERVWGYFLSALHAVAILCMYTACLFAELTLPATLFDVFFGSVLMECALRID